MASGWSPEGRKGETTSNSGTLSMVPGGVTPDPGPAAGQPRRGLRSFSSSGPDPVHLVGQLLLVPGVVHHQVSTLQPGRAVDLGGDAGLGVLSGHPPEIDQAIEGDVHRGVHHHHRGEESVSRRIGLSSGMSRTTIWSVSANSSFRWIMAIPMAGWVMALRAANAVGVTEGDGGNRRSVDVAVGVHESRARSGRSSAGRRDSPGVTTSRAIRSASTSTAPFSTSRSATIDFPAPIPPVSPTASTPGGRSAVAPGM